MEGSRNRPAAAGRVGPRDGLQMSKAVMPTAAKLEWMTAMVAAGVREMEVAASSRRLRCRRWRMRATVVRTTRTQHPQLNVIALAPICEERERRRCRCAIDHPSGVCE